MAAAEAGPEAVEIRALGPGDDRLVLAASHLFDGPTGEAPTAWFLRDAGHHLLIAYRGNDAVGFVSGVEVTHPDKGTEMFLYELAVDEASQGQGIGRALVKRLEAVSRQRGCYGMWVITDGANTAALATYQGAGATAETEQVVLVWTF